MKILIFSDTHLTEVFDSKKYRFLVSLINKYDKVIINGDFWSNYSSTFDSFVNSKWKKLFPLLLAKNTVYVYGNHDRKEWCDKRVELFSKIQVEKEKIVIDDLKYKVLHGHTVSFDSIHSKWWVNLIRNSKFDVLNYRIQTKILELFGGKTYEYFGGYMNRKYKRILRENVIIGHTHSPEFDLKAGFINSGYIYGGFAHYLDITDEKAKLIHKRY
ncbi:metallophosphoesterase family protein [Candidatus Dojkabacteria bacterium]|jgi:predicted phosphodiesterase|nr:metallophosphoesterase family protein [Candidatus Dojkabacteria bacterium]